LLVLIGTGAIINGCGPRKEKPPAIGTDRWDLANASELGIKPVPGKRDWYRMPARRGELKRAKLHFTGRPLPYKTVTDSLPMALDSAGRPKVVRIAARPGQVVTVLAFGKVDVDGPDGPLPPTDAAGLVRKEDNTRLAQAYPLARSDYVPAENVGTLIGSVDGFKTSFVIGSNASFVMPKDAGQLMLGFNALPIDYRSATGGLGIKWIVNDAPTLPTAIPYSFDTPRERPFFVLTRYVLTSVHFQTFYQVPIEGTQPGTTEMAEVPLGEAHVSIYESH
jgi:hypothetical protein